MKDEMKRRVSSVVLLASRSPPSHATLLSVSQYSRQMQSARNLGNRPNRRVVASYVDAVYGRSGGPIRLRHGLPCLNILNPLYAAGIRSRLGKDNLSYI